MMSAELKAQLLKLPGVPMMYHCEICGIGTYQPPRWTVVALFTKGYLFKHSRVWVLCHTCNVW